MKQHLSNHSQNSANLAMPAHGRHDSTHSIHTELGHHGGPVPNRGGGYQHQGSRGRGYPNSAHLNNMGYPPPNPYPRGPGGQGRGNVQPSYPQRGGLGVPNSPQPGRASPHVAPAMPNPGTPHMQQAVPVP